MKSEGHTAYRFSIEWSPPLPDARRDDVDADEPDPTAVAAYDTLIEALVAQHVTPMVTLQHFALPDWLDDVTDPSAPQGWERPRRAAALHQFCSWAGARWGKSVDWWITINEPLNLVLGGYMQGSFPPGVVLDFDRAFAVGRAEIARARRLLRRAQGGRHGRRGRRRQGVRSSRYAAHLPHVPPR